MGGALAGRLIAGNSLNACSNLKYVVVTNNEACMSNNAFNGCISLLTYVARAEGENDNMSYTGTPFAGAGAKSSSTSTDKPPLVIAGGNATKASTWTSTYRGGTATKYNLVILNTPSITGSVSMTNGNYYYLTTDVSTSAINVAAKSSDCVLDLNHYTLSRSITSAEEKGTVINAGSKLFRLDDSCTTDATTMGSVSGGKNTGASDSTSYGGGISITSNLDTTSASTRNDAQMDFVNGSVSGNEDDLEGGGIDMRGYSSKTAGKICTLNMYGGQIHDNLCTGTTYGGGGLKLMSNCIFNMYGGSINDNKTCGANGAGIYMQKNSTATMSSIVNMYDGEVLNNKRN